jgi:glycosyltransferase involved in cell wall biosynthesis
MSKKLKIGFDAKRAFLNAAGLGNYSRNTINTLAVYFPENSYFLFTPQLNPARFQAPKNSLSITPNSFWWRLLKPCWRSYKISGLAQKAKLDIYHGLSHELPFGIEKTGTKSVVTIHDVIFKRFPELYKPADRKIYARKVKHACEVADRIIAISNQTKSDLLEFFNVKPEKVEVIYQPINPVYFEEVSDGTLQAVREIYVLPEVFMLAVGTIEARKNLESILKAMELLDRKIPLVVVGRKTKYLQTIQHLIQKLKGQLVFLHQVDDRDLSRIYRLAKLMLYPSVYEGFGLPIVEAQACGCPVITSKGSSMPEAGGDGAHYVQAQNEHDIKQAIERLLDNEEYRDDLVRKGKENARRFTPETYAQQLMELYKKLYDAR